MRSRIAFRVKNNRGQYVSFGIRRQGLAELPDTFLEFIAQWMQKSSRFKGYDSAMSGLALDASWFGGFAKQLSFQLGRQWRRLAPGYGKCRDKQNNEKFRTAPKYPHIYPLRDDFGISFTRLADLAQKRGAAPGILGRCLWCRTARASREGMRRDSTQHRSDQTIA